MQLRELSSVCLDYNVVNCTFSLPGGSWAVSFSGMWWPAVIRAPCPLKRVYSCIFPHSYSCALSSVKLYLPAVVLLHLLHLIKVYLPAIPSIWCLPLVWNLRAVIWFHFAISSLVLLPSPVTLSVLSFSACWSILLNFFQKILQYFSLRDGFFMACVQQLGEVSWSVVMICAAAAIWHWYLLLCIYIILIFFYCFCLFLFLYSFKIWYW